MSAYTYELEAKVQKLTAERDRLAALVGGYETAIIRFVRLHEGEDDELGRGVCDVGILRAALAAGKGGKIPVVADPSMPEDRVAFVDAAGKVVGTIENPHALLRAHAALQWYADEANYQTTRHHHVPGVISTHTTWLAPEIMAKKARAAVAELEAPEHSKL